MYTYTADTSNRHTLFIARISATIAKLGRIPNRIISSSRGTEARLAKNTAYSLGGSISSQGSAMLAAIAAANLLGATQFGYLALIQSTALMMGSFGELGLSLTATKFVGQFRTSDPMRAGRLISTSLRITVVLGFVMALIMIAVAPYILANASGRFSAEIIAACGLLIFEMLNRVQIGALAGLEAFDCIARIQLFRGALTLPFVAAGAFLAGIPGTILAFSSSSLGTFLWGQRLLRSKCRANRIPLKQPTSLEHGVLGTSFSIWLSTLLTTGSGWAVAVLLSKQPSGLTELGIYNAADKWKTALLFLPNLLFQVNLTMLSHFRAENDYPACRRTIAAGLASTIMITGLAGVAVCFLAPFLMSWYGRDFSGSSSVLVIGSFASIGGALYTVSSGALWALGEPSRMLRIDAVKTALLVGLCWAGLGNTAQHLMLASLISLSIGSAVILLSLRQLLFTNRKLEVHDAN